MSTKSFYKTGFLVLFFVVIIVAQISYDAMRPTLPSSVMTGISPTMIRLVDMGFHSAAGSFLWIPTMPEILELYFDGNEKYLSDLSTVNAVDPKLSYPYAFSVITLPVIQRLPNRDTVALVIGERGIANGDPDWRVPYYMAADYYLDLKDTANALKYYDIAAHTPGVPDFAKRFALNFGALPDDRQKTEALWESIRDTTSDPGLKNRADAYVYRLKIFDFLEAAARAYKTKNGKFPPDLQTLITAHVIPYIPADPFGYTFKLQPDGTVGLDLTVVPKDAPH